VTTGRRTGLPLGFFLLPVVAVVFLVWGAAAASADFTFKPCDRQPDGPTRIGGAEVTTSSETWKKLNRARLSQRFVSPAAREGGVPVFPVRSGSDTGQEISARLAGSFVVLRSRGRRVKATVSRFIRRADGSAWVRGKVAGREIRLFQVRNTKVKRKTGVVSGIDVTGGRTELSGAFARELKKRVGFRAARSGMRWGGLYLTWSKSPEPDVTPPDPAPAFEPPDGASDLASGRITWNVREKWIQYVATGDPASPIAPAEAGPQESKPGGFPPLVYSFTFPFSAGWVDGSPVTRASVSGDGGVYFRYCGDGNDYRGINFTVRDPEVRLDGATSSLVFTVKGIDGTPFSPERTIVVDLNPETVTPAPSGQTTTWTGIPGTVPAGATGVFGDFYLPGTEFGSVDLEIERVP